MERKNKAGVAILTYDKIDFETTPIVRSKEKHCIMIKGTIQQEDITLVNICATNTEASKYLQQIFMDIRRD